MPRLASGKVALSPSSPRSLRCTARRRPGGCSAAAAPGGSARSLGPSLRAQAVAERGRWAEGASGGVSELGWRAAPGDRARRARMRILALPTTRRSHPCAPPLYSPPFSGMKHTRVEAVAFDDCGRGRRRRRRPPSRGARAAAVGSDGQHGTSAAGAGGTSTWPGCAAASLHDPARRLPEVRRPRLVLVPWAEGDFVVHPGLRGAHRLSRPDDRQDHGRQHDARGLLCTVGDIARRVAWLFRPCRSARRLEAHRRRRAVPPPASRVRHRGHRSRRPARRVGAPRWRRGDPWRVLQGSRPRALQAARSGDDRHVRRLHQGGQGGLPQATTSSTASTSSGLLHDAADVVRRAEVRDSRGPRRPRSSSVRASSCTRTLEPDQPRGREARPVAAHQQAHLPRLHDEGRARRHPRRARRRCRARQAPRLDRLGRKVAPRAVR